MFPNAVLTDQETQVDSEIYSVAEAKQRLSTKLGQYRDGQLEQDEEKRSFWNYTAGLRPQRQSEDSAPFHGCSFFVYEQQGISHAVAKALYGEI